MRTNSIFFFKVEIEDACRANMEEKNGVILLEVGNCPNMEKFCLELGNLSKFFSQRGTCCSKVPQGSSGL